MVPSFFRLAVQRIAILMGVYFISRMLFLLWNWNLYSSFPAGKIGLAFFYGLRFDLSAIVLTNFAVMLLWLAPAAWTRRPWLTRIELALFAVINLICIGSNFADAEFVKFIGKRSGFDMLLIHQDLEQQSFSLLTSYWQFCVGLVLTISVAVWFARPLRTLQEAGPLWLKAGWRLLAVALLVVAARGGFQFKPLHPMHAYFTTHHELGLLTLNTPFNVIKSRPSIVERQRFFSGDREPIVRLRDMTKLTRPPLALAKDFNVVILLVESLSTEYVGAANDFEGYTPFLDSLAKESFFYKYNFANARRSIEGLPAVICGIPNIMAEPVITSDFSNNRYECLPNILSRRGYSTYFLHGAHNGSMHFDTFSRIAGFENFVGLNEFPKGNKQDLDEYWGVLDEPMLQHAVKLIDLAPKPVMMGVFTLSSHHPYFIPPQHTGKFPKGDLEIHESMGYADYAIEQFFKSARKKPWFNKTIFVITGDHTQKFYHKEYGNLLGYYRVPLFIYVPGLKDHKIAFDPARLTQHIDVVPSVMDLLGVNLPDRLLVGQSVFDTKAEGRAYSFNPPEYWYLDTKLFMNMRRNGEVYNVKKHEGAIRLIDATVDASVLDPAIANLKSVAHYLNEGLIRNNLYGWRQSL